MSAPKIKFCGITREQDAELAVSLGAWAVGMILWPHSPRAVPLDRAAGLAASLKRRADSGAPPIPVGGPGNDLIAVAVGVVAYLALAFAFHPVVIGVPVVGA